MKVEQPALVRLSQKYPDVYFSRDDFIFLHRSSDGEGERTVGRDRDERNLPPAAGSTR